MAVGISRKASPGWWKATDNHCIKGNAMYRKLHEMTLKIPSLSILLWEDNVYWWYFLGEIATKIKGITAEISPCPSWCFCSTPPPSPSPWSLDLVALIIVPGEYQYPSTPSLFSAWKQQNSCALVALELCFQATVNHTHKHESPFQGTASLT